MQKQVLLRCEGCGSVWTSAAVLVWEEHRFLSKLLSSAFELIVLPDVTLEERQGKLYHMVRDHEREGSILQRRVCVARNRFGEEVVGSVRVIVPEAGRLPTVPRRMRIVRDDLLNHLYQYESIMRAGVDIRPSHSHH